MATVAYWIRAPLELLLYPLDRLARFWGLTVVALLTALLMIAIIARVTPQARIRRARARMAGALYEIRLFLDSPSRVLRSQATLLGYTVVYLVLLLPALLVMAPIIGVLYLHLDVRYGLEPIAVGRSVVVAVAIDDDVDGYEVAPAEPVDGLAVTAPPVYVEDENKVYMRVDVIAPGTHRFTFAAGGQQVTKTIVAATAAAGVAPERRRGIATLWARGHELPLPAAGPVSAVTVAYPIAQREWLGLDMPWWLYWLLLATVAALVIARPLRVAI